MGYVFFIAIFNLGLGALAAVLLNRRASVSTAVKRAPIRRKRPARKPLVSGRVLKTDKKSNPKRDSEPVESGATAGVPGARETFNVPPDWTEVIGNTPYFDAVEPSARLLQKIALNGLAKLIELNDLLARLSDDAGDGPFSKIGNEIKGALGELRRRSQSVLDLFDEAGYQFGPMTPHAVRLESLIQSSLEEWSEFEARLEGSDNAEDGRSRAVKRVYHDLARRLHALRDEMDEIAVASIVTSGRVLSVTELDFNGKKPEFDGRLALEATFASWLNEDPTRVRLVSFVLMDLDGTDQLNQECGLEIGDRLVTEVARVLLNGIRNNRGFDRFFRLTGQQFVMFLGDTGAKNGAFASERIRQSLTQTTFRMRNKPVEVRCTAAVTGLQKSDTCEHILERLLRAVRKAKKADSEATVIVQDGKAVNAEAKVYQSAGQTVEV